MNMKEKLELLGKNSIVLKIAKKEKYKLGATRFGGKPDVPPDFVWPTYSDDEIELSMTAKHEERSNPYESI